MLGSQIWQDLNYKPLFTSLRAHWLLIEMPLTPLPPSTTWKLQRGFCTVNGL